MKLYVKMVRDLLFTYDVYAFLPGGRYTIRLGDKEVEYNLKFRFYICTKMSNPHYTPEISTKTTIVNFSVKEQGKLHSFILHVFFARKL